MGTAELLTRLLFVYDAFIGVYRERENYWIYIEICRTSN